MAYTKNIYLAIYQLNFWYHKFQLISPTDKFLVKNLSPVYLTLIITV